MSPNSNKLLATITEKDDGYALSYSSRSGIRDIHERGFVSFLSTKGRMAQDREIIFIRSFSLQFSDMVDYLKGLIMGFYFFIFYFFDSF